jgi:hypothetical protein
MGLRSKAEAGTEVGEADDNSDCGETIGDAHVSVLSDLGG